MPRLMTLLVCSSVSLVLGAGIGMAQSSEFEIARNSMYKAFSDLRTLQKSLSSEEDMEHARKANRYLEQAIGELNKIASTQLA